MKFLKDISLKKYLLGLSLAWGGACRKVLRKIPRETESVMKFRGEGGRLIF